MNLENRKVYSLEINDRKIQIEILKKSKIKTMSLRIDNTGKIKLVSPLFLPDALVIDFIKRKSEWILKHIDLQELSEETYFLGEKISVEEDQNSIKKGYKFLKDEKKLIVSENAYYDVFLNDFAKKILPKHITKLAVENGFLLNKIYIRRQNTRWGSCSSKKNISINYKIVKYSQEIINYVIYHELCHLKEMNHSVKFWNLLETYVKDAKKIRYKLKKRIYK